MTVKSAGILIYKKAPQLEVFLGHMGGPFWEQKDEGAWGIQCAAVVIQAKASTRTLRTQSCAVVVVSHQ